MRGEVCGPGGGGGVEQRRAQAAQRRARLEGLGGQGTGGAHEGHVVHARVARVRDTGRVEGQRLVERVRELPGRKEGVRSGARCEAEKAKRRRRGAAAAQAARTHEGPDWRVGGRARAARSPRTSSPCS